MDFKDKKKYIHLLLISGIVVIVDQLTKIIISRTLTLYNSIDVIPGLFNITHILNPGGAFGFLANENSVLRAVVFLFVSSIAICFIFYFYMTTPSSYRFLSAGFALIFGGAIGNMIDRIRLGKVIDFLDFYINDMHWPAFNIADSAISIGMAIFIFHILFKKMPS